jgi:hypothetical protein
MLANNGDEQQTSDYPQEQDLVQSEVWIATPYEEKKKVIFY